MCCWSKDGDSLQLQSESWVWLSHWPESSLAYGITMVSLPTVNYACDTVPSYTWALGTVTV